MYKKVLITVSIIAISGLVYTTSTKALSISGIGPGSSFEAPPAGSINNGFNLQGGEEGNKGDKNGGKEIGDIGGLQPIASKETTTIPTQQALQEIADSASSLTTGLPKAQTNALQPYIDSSITVPDSIKDSLPDTCTKIVTKYENGEKQISYEFGNYGGVRLNYSADGKIASLSSFWRNPEAKKVLSFTSIELNPGEHQPLPEGVSEGAIMVQERTKEKEAVQHWINPDGSIVDVELTHKKGNEEL